MASERITIPVSIPAAIVRAIQQGIGRPALKRQFHLSENDARFYCNAVRREPAATPSPLPLCALLLADLHVPHHAPAALSTALARGQAAQPSHVVLLGDIIDFYQLSFWAREPGKSRFRDEVQQCRDVLRTIANAFPAAQKIFISGNHEERLPRYLWTKSPELYGIDTLTVPALLQLDTMGYTYIDNAERLRAGQGAYSLGGVALLHGHELKVSYGAVNIPRLYYQRVKRPVIVAHHHKTDMYYPRLLNHAYDQAHSVGCLCDLSPEYSLVNDWNWGIALLRWNDAGAYTVENQRV